MDISRLMVRGCTAPGRQWDWENWPVLTTATRWDLLMLVGETDLIPRVRAALCCGAGRTRLPLWRAAPSCRTAASGGAGPSHGL